MRFDVIIIGSGVIGSALAVEARRRGLEVACVGPDEPSPSFLAGDHFRLNTWSLKARASRVPSVDGDQHASLSAHIRRRDPSTFPVARTLSDAAFTALKNSNVTRHVGLARDVVATADTVRIKVGRTTLHARAAVLCLGWGPLKVQLDRARAVATIHKRAFDFTNGLLALARGELDGQCIAVVGAGPSALSFLEAAVDAPVQVLWFRTGAPPNPHTGVGRMFAQRYRPLFSKLSRSRSVETIAARVHDVSWKAGTWSLASSDGETRGVDTLVWCGGFEPPLELINTRARSLEPLVLDGVRVALQRHQRNGPVPVFQIGPALDQLGLVDWDTGPFSEWFEKGKRLLTWLEQS
jgi:Pyridine nucleotide-disulphide oxidoreductase